VSIWVDVRSAEVVITMRQNWNVMVNVRVKLRRECTAQIVGSLIPLQYYEEGSVVGVATRFTALGVNTMIMIVADMSEVFLIP